MAQANKIALISAEWHGDLVGVAETACRETLVAREHEAIEAFKMPGSLELPLLAKKLAETGEYAAIIAFGLIVDGGIYRHEFVGASVIDGFMRVGLDTGVPVLSCVLTPQQFREEDAHKEFFRSHLEGKGVEAAESALQTMAMYDALESADATNLRAVE